MRTLVLNRSNVVNDGQNNKLVFNYPNSVKYNKSYISVASIHMYYSWFNITSSLGNNTFQYSWTNNAGVSSQTTITIPDGLYDISQLNDYLHSTMVSANRYLINNLSGENFYYINFIINPTRYAVQISLTQVPTSLPAGYTAPTGGFNTTGFPPSVFLPILTIGTKFGEIIGFSPPTIGSGTATSDYLSTQSPNIQPNSTILITCSGIDNPAGNPSNVIYSITPSVNVGEAIIEKPPSFLWSRLIDGTYNKLQISFLGTDLSPLIINDPQITIVLAFAQEDEVKSK